MSDFLIAYTKVRKNEGGYANHPNDRGGETWKGIARNFHPAWEGWKIVDEYRKKTNFPKNLEAIPGLQDKVLSFYKNEFWNRMRGDEISNQEIATNLFDSCVNVGVSAGIKIMQRAAFELPLTDPEGAAKLQNIIYGTMDLKTLKKLNVA